MQNNDKKHAYTRPQQSALSKLTGGLWRTVAPLALASLASGLAAPLQAQTTVPAINAEIARTNFYAQLNQDIQNDPVLRGHALVLDPTPYASTRDLRNDANNKLRSMIATWPNAEQNPVSLRNINDALLDMVNMEDASLGAANSGRYVKLANKLSPDLALLSTAQNTHFTTNNPRSANYVCLAIGTRAQINPADVLDYFIPLTTQAYTTLTPDFKNAVNAADSTNTSSARHELGHCLRGNQPRAGETLTGTEKREEAAADAFEILYRIQSGEPAMATKIETSIQWRRAMQVMATPVKTSHDTSKTLRFIAADLRKNSNFSQSLAGLTISALEAKASAYADRATLMDYPHLADAKLSTNAKLALSTKADIALNDAAQFVAGMSLVKDYSIYPEKLSTQTALTILQLAHTSELHLIKTPDNHLQSGLQKLRENHPKIMQEADKLFAAELARYPDLSGTTSVTASNQASSSQTPSSGHQPQRARSIMLSLGQ